MANIPANVILIWTGTHASIPAGWSRETTLDDKFPKGHGAESPNTTGGSNTHTHSDGGHTHTLNAHTHTYATGNSGTYSDWTYSGSNGGSVAGNHNHSSGTSNTSSGGTLSNTVTWASVNQEPPYHTVIFIKPSGVSGSIQVGICSHFYSSSAPIGWNFCNGSNSTPDLRNKYLKGASTGANAGTTGGGTAHQHTITHNHSAVNHSHTGGLGAYSGEGRESGGTDPNNLPNTSHTHVAYLADTSSSVADYTKTDAGSGDTIEPAYKKLGIIKNNGGDFSYEMVGLWLGTIITIPTDWVICDGNNGTLDLRDKFVKIGTDLTENNATGGANTHNHTGVVHTHTSSGTHTHTGATGTLISGTTGRNGTNQGNLFSHLAHTHTLSSISASTSVYANGTSTPASVDNQPAYRTVAYIMNTLNQSVKTTTSKANIKQKIIKTVNSKASIKKNITKSLTSKAFLIVKRYKIINSKANLNSRKTKTVNSKANIKAIKIRTLNSKANLVRTTTRFLTSKSRITISNLKTINAKALIYSEIGQTVRQISPKIEIQWDGITWTDESIYFLSSQGNEQLSGVDGEGIASTLDVELDNTSDRFTPDNTTPNMYWIDFDWQYRKKIIIDHTKVSGDQVNFRSLVSFTSLDLNKAQVSGNDLYFTDIDGNKLSHEIETFTQSTGALIAWVKIPSLSSTIDTDIYLYYGNASCASQQDVANVWVNYEAVHHLKLDSASSSYLDVLGKHNSMVINTFDQFQVGSSQVCAVGDVTGTDYQTAQSFIPAFTTLSGLFLARKTTVGIPTGDIVIEIRTDNAGSPTGGTVLATKQYTLAQWNALPTTTPILGLNLSGLTVGATYWIVVRDTNINEALNNSYKLGYNSAGGYASGACIQSTNGGATWGASIGDLYFYTIINPDTDSVIEKGMYLDGVNDFITFTDLTGAVCSTSFSLSFILKPNVINVNTTIFDGRNGGNEFWLGLSSASLQLILWTTGASYNSTIHTLSDTNSHKYTIVFKPTSYDFIIDDVLVKNNVSYGGGTIVTTGFTAGLRIGVGLNGVTRFQNGVFDQFEVKLGANIATSGEAITGYNNQFYPSTFMSFGDEITQADITLYRYLKPRVPIRVSVIIGFEYKMFTGYIKNIHPDVKSKICSLECYDNQVLVYNKEANGIVYEDNRSDQLLTILATLADLTPAQYIFDVGLHIVNFGYFEERNVWPVMGEIASAERGRIFFDRNGILIFWNRDRLHNQPSISNLSRNDWILDLDYSISEHEIKNNITVQAKPRSSAGIQTVWSNGDVQYLNPYTDTLVMVPSNGSQSAWLDMEDPCTLFLQPIPNIDFTANSEQDGSGTDLTNFISINDFKEYGNAVFLNVVNTGNTDAYLTKFQVRGNPAVVLKYIQIIVKDDTSISRYGRQDETIENNFIQNEWSATEIAYEELWRRQDAMNNFKINIIGNPGILCGDIVSVEYLAGTYKNFMIDKLDWSLDDGGFKETLALINPYIFPSIQRVDARANIKGYSIKTLTAKADIHLS